MGFHPKNNMRIIVIIEREKGESGGIFILNIIAEKLATQGENWASKFIKLINHLIISMQIDLQDTLQ